MGIDSILVFEPVGAFALATGGAYGAADAPVSNIS